MRRANGSPDEALGQDDDGSAAVAALEHAQLIGAPGEALTAAELESAVLVDANVAAK